MEAIQHGDKLFGMFGPRGNSEDAALQENEARRARQAQSISADRQMQIEQQKSAELDAASGRAGRLPRGRRLLLASTGEQGIPQKRTMI